MDSIPEKTQLFMKGCAGLFAIISVIFYVVFVYPANSAYWKGRSES